MNENMERYFASLRGKRVLVLGLGVSNRPLAKLLLDAGALVTGCDRAPREQQNPEVLALERRGMALRLGERYLQDLSGDLAFRTPGMHPDLPELKALRQSVYDEIDEYRSIVEDPEFRKFFDTIGDDPLKTAPKGFPKDWEHIDYLKPRNFIASGPLDEKTVCDPGFMDMLAPAVAQAARFNRFMNFTIEDFI